MNCTRAETLMHAALDGESEPLDRQALQDHIAQCPACLAMWKQYQAMDDGLQWLAGSVPVDGWADPPGVNARRVDGGRKLIIRLRTWSAAAAMIVVSAGLGWLWLGGAPGIAPHESSSGVDVAVDTTPREVQLELLGASSKNYIAVPQSSSEPNVHIVWLYNTTRRAAGESSGTRASDGQQLVRAELNHKEYPCTL